MTLVLWKDLDFHIREGERNGGRKEWRENGMKEEMVVELKDHNVNYQIDLIIDILVLFSMEKLGNYACT